MSMLRSPRFILSTESKYPVWEFYIGGSRLEMDVLPEFHDQLLMATAATKQSLL